MHLTCELSKSVKHDNLFLVANGLNILAWRIPCTEEAGGLESTGSQRVGHNWVTNFHFHAISTGCGGGCWGYREGMPVLPYFSNIKWISGINQKIDWIIPHMQIEQAIGLVFWFEGYWKCFPTPETILPLVLDFLTLEIVVGLLYLFKNYALFFKPFFFFQTYALGKKDTFFKK